MNSHENVPQSVIDATRDLLGEMITFRKPVTVGDFLRPGEVSGHAEIAARIEQIIQTRPPGAGLKLRQVAFVASMKAWLGDFPAETEQEVLSYLEDQVRMAREVTGQPEFLPTWPETPSEGLVNPFERGELLYWVPKHSATGAAEVASRLPEPSGPDGDASEPDPLTMVERVLAILEANESGIDFTYLLPKADVRLTRARERFYARQYGGNRRSFVQGVIGDIRTSSGARLPDIVPDLARIEYSDAFPALIVCAHPDLQDVSETLYDRAPHRHAAVLSSTESQAISPAPGTDFVVADYAAVALHQEALKGFHFCSLILADADCLGREQQHVAPLLVEVTRDAPVRIVYLSELLTPLDAWRVAELAGIVDEFDIRETFLGSFIEWERPVPASHKPLHDVSPGEVQSPEAPPPDPIPASVVQVETASDEPGQIGRAHV